MDLFIAGTGGLAASLIQVQNTNNAPGTDGSLFWQNNNMGQGQGGYNGLGTFTVGAWHRATFAVDLAAGVITKFVDGIKQDDWVQVGLDLPRRSLQPTALLFADADNDDRRLLYVNSIQIRSGKLTDSELVALGGPSAQKIAVIIP